jgi:hypothetical protein
MKEVLDEILSRLASMEEKQQKIYNGTSPQQNSTLNTSLYTPSPNPVPIRPTKPLPKPPSSAQAQVQKKPNPQQKQIKQIIMQLDHPPAINLRQFGHGLTQKATDTLRLLVDSNSNINSEDQKIVGLKWTDNGNIVISLDDRTSLPFALANIEPLASLITPTAEKGCKFYVNTPWTKIQINGCPTHWYDHPSHPADPPIEDSELWTILEEDNPTLGRRNPHMPISPRWISDPTRTSQKQHSSIVLTFNDSAAAQAVLKKGTIWFLGTNCSVSPHIDKPRLRQCSNCGSFKHTASRCGNTTACFICTEDHPTDDHPCDECMEEIRYKCPHTIPKCTNCKGPHRADDKQCPTRAKISGTKVQPANTTNAKSAQASKRRKPTNDNVSKADQLIEERERRKKRISEIVKGFKPHNINPSGIKHEMLDSLLDGWSNEEIWKKLQEIYPNPAPSSSQNTNLADPSTMITT